MRTSFAKMLSRSIPGSPKRDLACEETCNYVAQKPELAEKRAVAEAYSPKVFNLPRASGTLQTISARSLSEAAFKGANKTGMMSVANHMGYFLHTHVRGGKQISRPDKSLRIQKNAYIDACFLFEQALKVSRT